MTSKNVLVINQIQTCISYLAKKPKYVYSVVCYYKLVFVGIKLVLINSVIKTIQNIHKQKYKTSFQSFKKKRMFSEFCYALYREHTG